MKPGPKPRPWVERFWSHVEIPTDPFDCWLWSASTRKSDGYGQFAKDCNPPKPKLVHRIMYELCFGPVPEGLDVDHECHNNDVSCAGGASCPHRPCCNPLHLRARTRGDNVRAGRTGEATAERNRVRWAAYREARAA